MSRNMVWDGWFHLAVWCVTPLGVFMLWHQGQRPPPSTPVAVFVGQLLSGWGGFNLVEGVIDHHLLNLHHVRDLPVHVPAYDWAFLAAAGLGLLMLRRRLSRQPRQTLC